MNNYIDGYRNYLVNVKKASLNTVDAYLRDASQFSEFCTSVEGLKDVSLAEEKTVSEYLNHLTEIGKSESTKTRITASVRCFFKYLKSIGAVNSDPTSSIRVHKNKRKLPDVLEVNEIISLLSQPDGADYKSRRDKAMMELHYATGIKVSELIDLKVYDVNLQVGILHTHSGAHERIIPIYRDALKHIEEYLNYARPGIVTDESEDRLFTNMNGKPLTRQGFWKIIKHYADKANIKKDITPQTLRHSFATHLLENGAQLKDLKDILGHSDITSTQIYAQVLKSKYVKSYTQFHPLAK